MDELLVFGAVLLLVCVGGALFGAPVAALESYACSSQANKMRLEHSWGPLQDCMVRVDGRWLPLANYRVIQGQQED